MSINVQLRQLLRALEPSNTKAPSQTTQKVVNIQTRCRSSPFPLRSMRSRAVQSACPLAAAACSGVTPLDSRHLPKSASALPLLWLANDVPELLSLDWRVLRVLLRTTSSSRLSAVGFRKIRGPLLKTGYMRHALLILPFNSRRGTW